MATTRRWRLVLAGSCDLVTTSNWAYSPLMTGVTYVRPLGETMSRVLRPVRSGYYGEFAVLQVP